MLLRKIHVMRKGWKRYDGDPESICTKIVQDCWNGKYYQTSTGHFAEFWTRDFAFCAPHLSALGNEEKVIKSLKYALSIFEKSGRVTTTISRSGKPLDIFTFGIDSLPLLLLTLKPYKDLVKKHHRFLEKEVSRFTKICIDQKKQDLKDKWFSSIKDNAVRKGSCYAVTMVALLQKMCKEFNIKTGIKKDFKDYLISNYWKENHFCDTLGSETISGDANTFPFWTGVVDDDSMRKKAVASSINSGLCSPFPMKYTTDKKKREKHRLLNLLAPNYEGNTLWMHLGLSFIDVCLKTDRKIAKKFVEKYSELVDINRNFMEVYSPDGSIFKTPFYHADEGMLWAAMHLSFMKKTQSK